MKKVYALAIAVAVVGVVFGTMRRSNGETATNYRLVTVESGDIQAVVSATGTLDAVTTVQVGTQVSGIIDEIYVDYNDVVEAGQVIARIDTTLLSNTVKSAEAQLARANAELRKASSESQRYDSLYDQSLVSDSEHTTIQYNLDVAKASVTSAEVELARARQNLNYATITSPIDGTVISRSMEVGQTVQASFSAPELFSIAGDLRFMQILAAVDESDIGLVEEGQRVEFTVQAYPDESFEGEVRQVRLQSSNQENIVNYTVVVDVANPDGKLLPGMTATVEFVVSTASDVIYVSNAALRYKPSTEDQVAAFERMRAEREASGEEMPRGDGPMGGSQDDRGMLWTLDEDGRLTPVPVHTGISDGKSTAVSSRGLEAGMQVIAGVSSKTSTSQSSSPFQQNQGGSRQPGPPTPGGF